MSTTDVPQNIDASGSAKRHDDVDNQGQLPITIEDLCVHIENSTKLAVESQDYLSYATVLDLTLGDPWKFDAEQASTILTTLHQSLAAYPVILYKVGWDLPELLLKYIDRFFVPHIENLPNHKPFRLVMSLFSLLCEFGNPRELLIRACELMLTTESELNSKRMAMMSLSDNEEEKQHQTMGKANGTNIDSAHNGFDVWDDTRQENVKFCTLFEVVRFCLQNIETPVPSSFLLEAARTLLQVAEDPNADLLSVSTYARRMFLLARDFSTKNENIVSPQEMQRVRHILVNFLSHSADVVVRKYTLKWAERLYVQMRKKVALAPPMERDFVYTETEYTRRMSEVMSRFAQLMLSYDYDPQTAVPEILGVRMIDGIIVGDMEPIVHTRVDNAEVLAENYWSRKLLKGPSVIGLAKLNTQLHFDGSRSKKANWKSCATLSLKIQQASQITQGTKDLLLYWALWVSNDFDTLMQDEVDHELLAEWLQTLLGLIATSKSCEEKFVTGSIVARALRFQTAEFAYNFCINIMRHSKSSGEQFVVVEALKMLVTGKISNPEELNKAGHSNINPVNATSGELCTQKSCIELDENRKREISMVSKDAIIRLKQVSHCVPFYYLNFLAVVPTDPKVVLEICDILDNMVSHCESMGSLSESCIIQINVLKKASLQLREQTLRNMQR